MSFEVSELDKKLFKCEYDCAFNIFVRIPLEISNQPVREVIRDGKVFTFDIFNGILEKSHKLTQIPQNYLVSICSVTLGQSYLLKASK